MSLADYDAVPYLLGGTIYGVQVTTTARMDSSGSRTVQPRFREKDGTPGEANGTAFTVDSTDWDLFTEVFEDNPVVTGAWTLAQLNAGQWGVRLNS